MDVWMDRWILIYFVRFALPVIGLGVKLVQVEGLLLLQVGQSTLSSLLPIFWDNVDDEKHLEVA